jgi:hypothetical protein
LLYTFSGFVIAIQNPTHVGHKKHTVQVEWLFHSCQKLGVNKVLFSSINELYLRSLAVISAFVFKKCPTKNIGKGLEISY